MEGAGPHPGRRIFLLPRRRTGRALRAGVGPQRCGPGGRRWPQRWAPEPAGAMSTVRPQFSIDDAFELSLEDAGPGSESSGIGRFGPLHFERRARFEVADEDKQSRLRYQNLENDEDGAQASPEPDGGVSTRDSGRTSTRSSQWSFSTISNSTQRSYNACCSWTQHPLIQKNCRVVLASFLLLLLGLGPSRCPALKTQSLVSFPGRISVQGAPGLGGGHHSSGLNHVEVRVEVPALPLSPAPALTLAAPSVCSAGPDRRGTGGGPLTSRKGPLLPWRVRFAQAGTPQVQPYPDHPASPPAGVSSAIFFVPGFLLLVPGVYHVIFIYCAVKGHRGFQFFYLPYFEK
ncbi:hypothetical protein MC885_007064 [Smutsia gigantea]|nr:hypothetical protein MC885_007064 [Smutsia gigantea]